MSLATYQVAQKECKHCKFLHEHIKNKDFKYPKTWLQMIRNMAKKLHNDGIITKQMHK